jgi:hypothetical protein
VWFPLHFDPFWDWNADDQNRHFYAFDDQFGSLARQVGTLCVFDSAQQELRDFLIGLLPRGMTATEFAQVFGVHKARLGRFKAKKEMPSPELTYAWLRKYRQTYPPVRYERVYDAVAVSAATERVDWERETSRMSKDRRQRREWREVSVKDAVLSYALAAPGHINKLWIHLARTFKTDLYPAIERPDFVDFLAELLAFASQMFGTASCNPLFVEASTYLANIDLDSSSDIFRLVDDIQRVWDARSRTRHLVARSWEADFEA